MKFTEEILRAERGSGSGISTSKERKFSAIDSWMEKTPDGQTGTWDDSWRGPSSRTLKIWAFASLSVAAASYWAYNTDLTNRDEG